MKIIFYSIEMAIYRIAAPAEEYEYFCNLVKTGDSRPYVLNVEDEKISALILLELYGTMLVESVGMTGVNKFEKVFMLRNAMDMVDFVKKLLTFYGR